MKRIGLKKINVYVFCLLIIFGAQTLLSQETEKKKVLSNETRNDNLIIYSEKTQLDLQQSEKGYFAFTDAKAVISTNKGKMILHAVKILHYQKKNLLVGENAKLILPDGKTRKNIEKISINLKHPLDYVIE